MEMESEDYGSHFMYMQIVCVPICMSMFMCVSVCLPICMSMFICVSLSFVRLLAVYNRLDKAIKQTKRAVRT